MFKIEVSEQEFAVARIGGEWWQRVPDEDDSSVFIVTAIHSKHAQDGRFYIVSGAFFNGPEFVYGTSGIRTEPQKEVVEEGGEKQALLERSA
jgi:hypothetical protein